MTHRTCSIEGCDRKHKGLGLCRTHLDRLNRTGTTSPPRSLSMEERFWPKVDKTAGPEACWPWLAAKLSNGYGMFAVKRGSRGTVGAHRVAYELAVGPIPAGLELDHLCHTNDLTCRLGDACPHRACVNPAHLEPVTGQVNNQRARGNPIGVVNALKTHCPQGHPYDEANTYHAPDRAVHRACRTCRRERKRVNRVA